MADGAAILRAMRRAASPQGATESWPLLDSPEGDAAMRLFLLIASCESDLDEGADNHYNAKAGHYCGDCEGCLGLWQFCNTNGEYQAVRGDRSLDSQAAACFRASNGFTNTQPWVASASCWQNPSPAKLKMVEDAWNAYSGDVLGAVIDETDVITDPLDAIMAVFEKLGELAAKLLEPAFWKRIGIVALGAAIAFFGLFLVNRDMAANLARTALGRRGGAKAVAAAAAVE